MTTRNRIMKAQLAKSRDLKVEKSIPSTIPEKLEGHSNPQKSICAQRQSFRTTGHRATMDSR